MLPATAYTALSRRSYFHTQQAEGARDKVARANRREQEEHDVLQTVAIVLIILWLLGFVTSYTMGGFIHILLVIAVVMILVRLVQGRRVL